MSFQIHEPWFGGQTHMYPCDRGMGGLGVGYHEFVASGGIVVCRYCGKRPPAEPLRVTCEVPRVTSITSTAGALADAMAYQMQHIEEMA